MTEEITQVCAAKGCTKDLPQGVLMCRMHWVMVSTETQQRMYKYFRDDPQGFGYTVAVRDAIKEVRDKEAARNKHAAEERHEFREALKLLKRIPYTTACGADLSADIQAFLRRHPDEC